MNKRPLCVLALVSLALCWLPHAAAQAPPKSRRQSSEPRIRVEVNLVSVLASVLDRNGRPVADLTPDSFELYEEGVKQKIERLEAETSQPLDLALMIDSSLSTFKELAFEREAAAHFIRQVVRPGDRLAVYQFSEEVVQLAPFSSDVPALQAAVRAMDAGTGTAMFDAVILGSRELSRGGRGRRRVIVLVTDAGETSSAGTYEEARSAALRSEALLYTVLIRPVKSESGRNTAGEHALVTITDVTGGAMYSPDSAEELDAIFDRIDRELRTQYRLGYYPEPRPPAARYRRLEVRVSGCVSAPTEKQASAETPACVVRHRRGYFTARAAE